MNERELGRLESELGIELQRTDVKSPSASKLKRSDKNLSPANNVFDISFGVDRDIQESTTRGLSVFNFTEAKWINTRTLQPGDIVKIDASTNVPVDLVVLFITGFPIIGLTGKRTQIHPIGHLLGTKDHEPRSLQSLRGRILCSFKTGLLRGIVYTSSQSKVPVTQENFIPASAELFSFTSVIGIVLATQKNVRLYFQNILVYYEETSKKLKKNEGILGNIRAVFLDQATLIAHELLPLCVFRNRVRMLSKMLSDVGSMLEEEPIDGYGFFVAVVVLSYLKNGMNALGMISGQITTVTSKVQKNVNQLKISVHVSPREDLSFHIISMHLVHGVKLVVIKTKFQAINGKYFLLIIRERLERLDYDLRNSPVTPVWGIELVPLLSKSQGLACVTAANTKGKFLGYLGGKRVQSFGKVLEYIYEDNPDTPIFVLSTKSEEYATAVCAAAKITRGAKYLDISLEELENFTPPSFPFVLSLSLKDFSQCKITDKLISNLLCAKVILCTDGASKQGQFALADAVKFHVVSTARFKTLALIRQEKFMGLIPRVDFSVAVASQVPALISNSSFVLSSWLPFTQLQLETKQVPLSVREKTVIDLSGQGLSEIPRFKFRRLLTDTITELDLSNNQFQALPCELANLKNLRSVIVENNPLETIPKSFRGSWTKLQKYLTSIENSKRWNRSKLVVVGQEGVGKTTLLKAFKSKTGKAKCTRNVATNGIAINRNLSLGDDPIQFDAWDFGGQEIFYPTHQFFLTDRAVFLVVFRLDQFQDSRVEYWMKTIKSVTNNSSQSIIFLVGTHYDKTLEPAPQRLASELQQKFTKQFYRALIPTVYFINSKSGYGIKELKTAIRSAVKDKGQLTISENWVRLHLHISNFQSDLANKQVEYVSWTDFETWAFQSGIPAAEHKLVAIFLTTTGTITYFNDQAGALDQFVVLNPEWLTKLMSTLITFQHSFIKKGILEEAVISHVFAAYPETMHQTLIGFLERYKVALHVKVKQLYLVPALLPETCQQEEFDTHWPGITPNETGEFLFHGKDYNYRFLPMGFFPQIVGRILLLGDVQVLMCWRNGIVIEFRSERGVLLFDNSGYLLRTRVRFPKNQAKDQVVLLTIISSVVKCTMQVLYNNPDESLMNQTIPCSHCLSTNPTTTEFTQFSYFECISAAVAGASEMKCGAISIPIHQLAPEVLFPTVEKIENSNLVLESALGSGGFGVVYRGRYFNPASETWTKVAVKELSLVPDSAVIESGFSDFLTEVTCMRHLRNECIVQLIGVQLSPTLRMVMELVPFGDLNKYLQRDVDIPWRWRLLASLDVAHAMEFLERNSFAHRDLRTENILVFTPNSDARVRVKLADFGLARQIIDISNEAGHDIWPYNPPERLAASQYDIISDVYSYGICLWEIGAREAPYAELENDERFYKILPNDKRVIDVFKVKQAIIEGLRPSMNRIHPDAPPAFVNLISECLQGSRELRPSFETIAETLQSIVVEWDRAEAFSTTSQTRLKISRREKL